MGQIKQGDYVTQFVHDVKCVCNQGTSRWFGFDAIPVTILRIVECPLHDGSCPPHTCLVLLPSRRSERDLVHHSLCEEGIILYCRVAQESIRFSIPIQAEKAQQPFMDGYYCHRRDNIICKEVSHEKGITMYRFVSSAPDGWHLYGPSANFYRF